MDGKTIRLRASCNACNESKVRCSQRKPTCARCERNGVECVYGLSRRTHKDAPPIIMPPSQRSRGPSRVSSGIDMNGASNNIKAHSSSNSNSSNSSNTWNGVSFTRSATATPATSTPAGGASPDRSISTRMATHDPNTALFGDYMSHFQQYAPQIPTTATQASNFGLLMDFGGTSRVGGSAGNGPHVDPLSAAASHFSTPVNEYASPWTMASFFNTHSNSRSKSTSITTSNPSSSAASNFTSNNDTDMAGYLTSPPSPPSLGDYACNCHSGVNELLTSMRGSGHDDRRLPIDAQLAKLKRCISSSESSMNCCHGRNDAEPIHIMGVATLIGFVIDEFEILACDLVSPALRRHLSPTGATGAGTGTGTGMTGASVADIAAALGVSTGADRTGSSSLSSGSDSEMSMAGPGGSMSLASHMEPRLSWGMLELEDDDEVDLRQRLYLLSFRKLERLLSQLTMYLRNLHDSRACLADPSRHMAFVMACDYTRLWLEKKAEDVKRLLSASVGDEAMDPSLV